MGKEWMKTLREVGARFEGGELDVKEELMKLLVTGRGGDAIAHFIGGRLTERVNDDVLAFFFLSVFCLSFLPCVLFLSSSSL